MMRVLINGLLWAILFWIFTLGAYLLLMLFWPSVPTPIAVTISGLCGRAAGDLVERYLPTSGRGVL